MIKAWWIIGNKRSKLDSQARPGGMVVCAWNPFPWEEADSERSAKDTRKNLGGRWEFENSLGYTQGEANPGSVRPCLKKAKTKTEVKISISFYQLRYPWWVMTLLRTWNFCSQNRAINCTIISVPAEEVLRKCWLLLSGQVGLCVCTFVLRRSRHVTYHFGEWLEHRSPDHCPLWFSSDLENRLQGTVTCRSDSTVGVILSFTRVQGKD